MSDFVPTHLYIKQHAVTGKKYFGKTVKDPVKYLGSGLHWRRHIKAHGVEHVKTIWSRLFTDEISLRETASSMSKELNVVNSTEWLNLVPENGVDGSGRFGPVSETTRAKISQANKGNKLLGKSLSQAGRERIAAANRGRDRSNISEATRARMSSSHIGKTLGPRSDAVKERISLALTGKKQQTITCIHCGSVGGVPVMKRWHFDRCKANSKER